MSKTITIELDDDQASELEAVARRMRLTPEELVSLALDQLTHEPKPYTPEQIAQIEEGLAQIARGETVPHEEVVRKARALVGEE